MIARGARLCGNRIRDAAAAALVLLALATPAQAVEIAPEPGMPELSLLLPPFAQWSERGLEERIEIRARSNYAAFIDQWELSLFRDGDLNRKYPLARYRGPAKTLSMPILWNGQVREGPPLRPGERAVAVLRVRDAAGNIDETVSEPMLIARYLMPAETRELAEKRRARRKQFEEALPPERRGIPVRGYLVSIPEGAGDYLSGLRIGPEGLRQLLPPGRYTLAHQTGRPGRTIPIDTISFAVEGQSGLVGLIGRTGTIPRNPAEDAVVLRAGYAADALIAGADALGAVLLPHGAEGEGRLAMALVDPAEPVLLLKDAKSRRAISLPLSERMALWGGMAGDPEAEREIGAPRLRQYARRFRAAPVDRFALPDTDIVPGTFELSLMARDLKSAEFAAGRHFDIDFAEGRVALTSAARKMIQAAQNEHGGGNVDIVARYSLPRAVAGAESRALVALSDTASLNSEREDGRPETRPGFWSRLSKLIFGG